MRMSKLVALLNGAAVMAVIPFQAAMAQPSQSETNTAEEPVGASKKAESAVDAAEEGPIITVTGSRLITSGNNSPTPVTVMSTEELAATTPSSIYDGLRTLPVFLPSGGQRTAGKADSNNSGSFLDLRGLGPNRVLVLLDGKRVPPTTTSGAVDTNILPQMLIQRVDVVTGGASAVYGSDAISGVVNYIIDRKFNGVKVQGQAGISSRGDAARQRLGIAAGIDLFGGRGHIEGSYEYYNSEGITSQKARENSARSYCSAGNGSVNSPRQAELENCLNTLQTYGGLIRSGALVNMKFNESGRLTPFIPGIQTNSATIRLGGDGVYNSSNSLLSSLETHQAFARFDFDVTDNVHFYAQGGYSRSRNSNNYQDVYLFDVRINRDNAYLPEHLSLSELTAVNAGMSSEQAFTFGRRMLDIPNFRTRSETDNIFINSGLSGDLGSSFSWELSYIFGRNEQQVTNIDNPNTARLFAAMDAVRNPAGEIVCRASLTDPEAFPGCMPLDIFGQGFADPEAWAWTRNDTDFTLTHKMHDVQGSIAGTLFDNWAGPVRIAVSGEYRHIRLDNTTDFPTSPVVCTALSTTSCGASVYKLEYVQSTVAPAHASQSVKEGAVELNIPLLTDFALAKELNLSLAGRYTNYSTVGSVKTWKAGIDWHVSDDLRFRGTLSRDIRAPTLYDLHGPVSTGTTAFTDQHILACPAINPNCSDPLPLLGATVVRTQGNPNLEPEKADTMTVGVVYRPHWLPRFGIALDYYKIDIGNAIATLSGVNSTVQTLCEASGGTSVYCSLYIRPLPFSDRTPANFPTVILSQPVNVARTKTHGVDGEINYSFDALGGEFKLRGLVSYQPSYTTVQFPTEPVVQLAGVADQPDWRTTAFLSYQSGPLTLSTQTRWRSAVRYTKDPRIIMVGTPTVEAVSFTNATLSYRFGESGGVDGEWFFNIENIFDKNPPVYSDGPGKALAMDDIIGRYFTSGFRIHF